MTVELNFIDSAYVLYVHMHTELHVFHIIMKIMPYEALAMAIWAHA